MPPSEPLRALLVKSQSHTCALPLGDVVETMRPLPIRPLSGPPPFVRGIAMVRGKGLPVLDLGALLGEPLSDDPTRFVTVRAGSRSAVLAVASVGGIGAFAETEFRALPPMLAGVERIAAMGVADDQLILTLRAARLIPEDLWPTLRPDEEVH
jgi:purine-binding chemotaxis protein CheW